MKNRKLRLLSFGFTATLGLMLPSIQALAAPDYEVHNTTETIGGTWASANTDVLIGPNANITVNGDWYVTANNFYIHPAAQITGTGTLHIMNPSTYSGKTAATTMLDAGSVSIGCKVSIENGSTVTLTAINPATAYAASGFTESAAQLLLTDLRIANNLNFNNVGAHVIMSNYNVVLSSAATITTSDLNTAYPAGTDPNPGTQAQAYLVTNGTGVVTRQGVANNTAALYPVGFTTSNYTPATVTNTAGAARDLNVRVSDKATAGVTSGNAAHGLNRFWQITGATAGTASLTLTHETANQGGSYDNTKDFITQQQATAGLWDVATIDPTPLVDTRAGVTVPTSGNTSFFSKSDDGGTSISVRLQVNPVALLQGALPSGSTTMTTTLPTLSAFPKTQPYNVAPFNYAGTESVTTVPANVTDWVLVELRDPTTPATILATKAGFILNNGSIVGTDGSSPVAFTGLPAGNYHISVRHRNHLGIRTAAAQTLALETTNSYNFTTSATQANGSNAQRQVGTVWAMWGGNVNGDAAIYNTATPSDAAAVSSAVATAPGNTANLPNYTGLSSVYSVYDVNMDGKVYNTATPSDRSFITGNVANNPANTANIPNSTQLVERLP